MGMKTTAAQLELPFDADRADGIPRGYKRTEVGVIPEDWCVSEIGNICTTSSGTTPLRRKKARYYHSGTVNWVKTLDLNNSKIFETEEKVTEIALRETVLTVFPPGTVLVAMYGGFNQIGRTGLLEIPATVNQAITAIQPGMDHLAPAFLLANLNYHVGYWRRVASSSRKDPNITSRDIRAFKIGYPKLPEQNAIAAALSDVDELIETLNKLIIKKRSIKLAAMQQLLTGKTRLPGFEQDPGHKQTEVGMIPKDWKAMPLGALFTFKNGLNKAKKFFGFGTPIVNYMDVFGRPGLRAINLIGRVSVSPQEIKNYEVQRGDVFFTRTSETVEEIGVASVMLDEPRDTVFSGFVLRARPKDDSLEDTYKKYCFTPASVRAQIVSKSTYTTRALTNGRSLSAVFIAVPTKAEQSAIATVLSDMDAEIAALERRRDKTKQIKQGVMQQLLTGRVRLFIPSEVEVEV